MLGAFQTHRETRSLHEVAYESDLDAIGLILPLANEYDLDAIAFCPSSNLS